MGKQKSSLSPDPKAVASMQLSENINNSLFNSSRANMNEITPDGILLYTQEGVDKMIDPFSGQELSIPRYSRSYELSPAAQDLYNRRNANHILFSNLITQRLQNYMPSSQNNSMNLQQPLAIPDPSHNPISEGTNHFSQPEQEEGILYDYGKNNGQQYENTLLDRLQPRLKQDREDLETRLSNQGLMPGSVSWNRTIDESNRKLNDARLAALLKSSEEQERLDNMQEKKAYFHNLAQAQSHQQKIDQKQQALHEILSLMQTIPASKFPITQHNPIAITPVDYREIAQNDYQNRFQEWKQKTQNIYDSINIGNKLVGSILSDRRMKRDIKPVGNLYQYRYASDPKRTQRIGVMAQEINKIRPDAVVKNSQGLQSVDYGLLFNTSKNLSPRK
ncbi:tail fiber domain-containing protein [Candidatus Liberibacter solanacearum]|uniref:Peptidase S74 domain-containing protein n=1 Tax=Candidatus Liberibacter solanacearum TaxID=556287 RepID=A0A1V2N6Y8_9HYPH|nr:tail fiber domain-containing protein [Candidatus Liberibacter solanacearum]ONI58468.1 hypothetical protein AYO25_05410 [Candidatus Liberibacter solanacearum]ONI58989.1 hypothetical protein AYJ09_00955 [Candidatus Liberibacter solanacearum]